MAATSKWCGVGGRAVLQEYVAGLVQCTLVSMYSGLATNICCCLSAPRPHRFTARFDPSTGLYLALTNPSIDRYGANADARNILALVYSKDLLSWRVAATVLVPNDGLPWDDSLWRTAYQYPGVRAALCCDLFCNVPASECSRPERAKWRMPLSTGGLCLAALPRQSIGVAVGCRSAPALRSLFANRTIAALNHPHSCSPTDWIIDGPDLLVAIRTAWGGAASFHDNNWLTFKQVADYRSLLPAATAVEAAAA